jgi:hypothetical protein
MLRLNNYTIFVHIADGEVFLFRGYSCRNAFMRDRCVRANCSQSAQQLLLGDRTIPEKLPGDIRPFLVFLCKICLFRIHVAVRVL